MRQFRSVLAKAVFGFSVVLMVLGAAAVSMAGMITIASQYNVTPGTPVTWVGSTNVERVGHQPSLYSDSYPITGANGLYAWMDIGTSWESLVPDGQKIASATLSFDTTNQDGIQASAYSIFAVPGTDKGVSEVLAAGGGGRGIGGYYAANTGYGLVTSAQIDSGTVSPGSAVSFNVTDLLAGWKSGALTTNVGQMMILGNYSTTGSGDTYWGAYWYNANAGPTITVTTTPTPEPATLVLLITGLLGLLCYAWRKRK